MKTNNQIRLIKMDYLITLLGVLLFLLKDAVRGFEDGYLEANKGGLIYQSHNGYNS